MTSVWRNDQGHRRNLGHSRMKKTITPKDPLVVLPQRRTQRPTTFRSTHPSKRWIFRIRLTCGNDRQVFY